MAVPRMTVLIPARNEEADIAGCIDAIGAQDYPLSEIQLIVADAVSDDDTRVQVEKAAAGYGFGEVLIVDNPARRTSVGLNVGLREARGTYLARVDARSRIQRDYLRTCEETLRQRPEVGVVGGAQEAKARSQRLIEVGIAGALRNRWATGMSRYRWASTSGACDTVWMGFFRTDELRALGGWADEVVLNEDYELNHRYRMADRIVWFDSSLRSRYLPRTSLLALARQHFRFGKVKGMSWARGQRLEARQVVLVAIPPAFGVMLVGLVSRFGLLALLLAPLSVVAVERAGHQDHHGERSSPTMASCAIVVLCGSWWAGVVVGLTGRLPLPGKRRRRSTTLPVAGSAEIPNASR
jgi:succinoglycan biosynthesis protein ExoA